MRFCMSAFAWVHVGPPHRLGLRELGAHKNVSNRNADATPLLRRVGDGATVDFDEGLKVARGWSVDAVFVPRFAAAAAPSEDGLEKLGRRSAIGVPIVRRQQTWGYETRFGELRSMES
jgi:hypothetical protein